MELRLLDSVRDYNELDLPIVHQGDIPSINQYAEKHGYQWKQEKNYLFGGYFTHPQTGNCLFVT